MAFDGQRIIVAATSGNVGNIYSLTAQSGPQVMASAVSPSAIALAGADLYFADKQAAQIWQVRSYATDAGPYIVQLSSGQLDLTWNADTQQLELMLRDGSATVEGPSTDLG